MKYFAIVASFIFGLAGTAQALTYDAAKVETDATALVTSATTLFDLVAPIILAVVGLGILLAFVKRVKKS